jgi:hypothetical protein
MTFDKDMFLIDEITDGLSFTQECNKPCKTCGLSKTACLSCLLDQPYKYLHQSK